MLGLGLGLNKIVKVIASAVSRIWSSANFSFSDNNQSWTA